jgi:hypothetical protein
MMTRACGCCDATTPEPRLVYESRDGGLVRTRFHHDEGCGQKWWRIESLAGELIANHADR